MASEMMRHVRCENREISYLLEQKPVKNLNLRIHKDGRVFLSANPDVPASEIDAFILSKRNRIYGWRLSVSERQKHHRLQQKATVGYPILGPSM